MKYEFTGDTKLFCGHLVRRIRAIRDINTQFLFVPKGTLGGWVEKSSNLSQDGESWVANEAVVCGNGKITHNALVSGNAWVKDCVITDNAIVTDFARVTGESKCEDEAFVGGNARIRGGRITENAQVTGYATVGKNACVRGRAKLLGSATALSDSCVSQYAVVGGTAVIGKGVHVFGNAKIYQGHIHDVGHWITLPIRYYQYSNIGVEEATFVLSGDNIYVAMGEDGGSLEGFLQHQAGLWKETSMEDIMQEQIQLCCDYAKAYLTK
jgi:carbonic anhydrase/acetyltransferase-like protein (isoleucine patch superfamily)